MLDDAGGDSTREAGRDGPEIVSGRVGGLRWWRIGGDLIELTLGGQAWTAKVRRCEWRGLTLDLGRRFDSEGEAVSWCEKMAVVLALDNRDGSAGGRRPG